MSSKLTLWFPSIKSCYYLLWESMCCWFAGDGICGDGGCKAHNGHCRLKMTRRPRCVVLMKEEVMSRRLRTSHWLTHQKVNENLKLWLPLWGKQFAPWLFTHKLQIGLKPFERAPCWGRPRDFIQRCSSLLFFFWTKCEMGRIFRSLWAILDLFNYLKMAQNQNHTPKELKKQWEPKFFCMACYEGVHRATAVRGHKAYPVLSSDQKVE